MSFSSRDWQSIKERRAFEQAEAERQREQEDLQQYQFFIADLDTEQRRLPPALQVQAPAFEEWRKFCPANESDPTRRAAIATQASLLARQRDSEIEAVKSGRVDPGFEIPASVLGKHMSVDAANAFNRAEFRKFAASNPSFDPATTNVLTEYLLSQNISIADAATYQAAFDRLRSFGLITERQPEPVVEPSPAPEPVPVNDGEWGIVPETGEPKLYSPRELRAMSAERYKRCFQLTAERRAAGFELMERLR